MYALNNKMKMKLMKTIGVWCIVENGKTVKVMEGRKCVSIGSDYKMVLRTYKKLLKRGK